MACVAPFYSPTHSLTTQLLTHPPTHAAQESRVEQEAEANAGVTPDTTYWVARVPYPWALLQSDAREDRMAWEVESDP